MTKQTTLLPIKAELRRLGRGPEVHEKPTGAGIVSFVARCSGDADEVLRKVVEVLRNVDEAALDGWPSIPVKVQVPEWFTSACAPAISLKEAEDRLAWRKKLSPDEQELLERERDWPLDNWLYWMEPENRQWFWWDAQAADHLDLITVEVEVSFWPFPWGALRWLFRAAGASSLQAFQNSDGTQSH